jgi:deoxyribodipyrimidine photo-lyase
MNLNINLIWFRQDLRITDNPAFFAACSAEYPIVPIYILDEISAGEYKMGSASKTWLQYALQDLDKKLNGKLQIFRGNALDIFLQICKKHKVNTLFYNRCYEPWRINRDTKIKAALKAIGVAVYSYNASLLREPWEELNTTGTHYKVFTPFYKKVSCALKVEEPMPTPVNIQLYDEPLGGCATLESLNLTSRNETEHSPIAHWEVGEEAAKNIYNTFLENSISKYELHRDYPSQSGVSRLAPYLHFGHISPKYLYYMTHKKNYAKSEIFIRQMIWRDFAYHTLYHNRSMPEACIQSKYEKFPWIYDERLLSAWQYGLTGYPIVDAGMRQLLKTGYMHNRVRMIVASFLVKNLNIHWQYGQNWFWDNLFDADLANNSFGWQWVAGCGNDSAPYFRIFNPILQSQKFDSNGDYIRKYVPELSCLTNKFIFTPWLAPNQVLLNANICLGKSYPFPIVEIESSRAQALTNYKTIHEKHL